MTDRDPRPGGRDPYTTLGVHADATDEEITRAYRQLARAHHPDAQRDTFAGLTDAYDVLRDPDRRRRYDQIGDNRAADARAATATRIPIRTDARRPQRPPPTGTSSGRDGREVELTLTFDQADLGTTATVTLTTELPCPGCAGTGITVPVAACAHRAGSGWRRWSS